MKLVLDQSMEENASELLQGLMETLPLGVAITDPAGQVLRVNPAFSAMTGYEEGEVSGSGLTFIDCHADNGTRNGYWAKRRDGSLFPLHHTRHAVHDRQGAVAHHIAVIADLTQPPSYEHPVARLAYYDELTGLPNRQTLLQQLSSLIGDSRSPQEGGTFAVLIIDLDRFKTFNDSLGHAIGDGILCEAARRIEATIRHTDMVSRPGRDEFIAILTNLNSPQDAGIVATNILGAMARPVVVDGHALTVTPSIGISLFPHDATTSEALLSHADTAMHHAKEKGRNNYQYYTQDLNQRAQQRMVLETGLRTAMASGELSLHYQPQVHWNNGSIIGVEALLRWQKADGSWVGPAEFIPVAEECGLIVDLGQWVLDQACRQRRRWNELGLPPFPVAVNCSALQFRQGDFLRQVMDTLAAHNVGPGEIELEITESVLMSNHELAGQILAEFKSAGIRIALDDFGTGYSSLAYLRRFAVDRLKIDASFIHDLEKDATNRAIVRSIVALGRSLNIELVAEGVETDAIAKAAFVLGCNYLQGYGLCRPLPADKLEDWLAARA
ncbi:MAG TPA: EAL domain-containing protein [Rhodocyclaceae bacterium]|nr:EAL domain-containing protein [Rhodocyclaceae bacterium]